MKHRFLLWLNALFFCAYLAGHLFDIFILVPNWRSGSIEDIRLYNDFFHRTNPADFYRVIMPVSTFLSVLCFLLFYKYGNPLRALLLISLLIDLGIDAVTWTYFLPINDYLFYDEGEFLDAAKVSQYVTSWITADYVRIGLIMIGFYTSVAALHVSYNARRTFRSVA